MASPPVNPTASPQAQVSVLRPVSNARIVLASEGRREGGTRRQGVSRQVSSAARPRMHAPVVRYEVLGDLPASLREATLCAAHMELLIEKVSAVGEDVQAPVLQIQEYWVGHLPDPDGDAAISDDVFTRLKNALDTAAHAEPDMYRRQLQGCITEAAAGGALD